MVTKSTKFVIRTLIGLFFLASVVTVGCKDKKKTEEAAPAPTEEVKSDKMTTDSIPVIDTGGAKELEPPKPPPPPPSGN